MAFGTCVKRTPPAVLSTVIVPVALLPVPAQHVSSCIAVSRRPRKRSAFCRQYRDASSQNSSRRHNDASLIRDGLLPTSLELAHYQLPLQMHRVLVFAALFNLPTRPVPAKTACRDAPRQSSMFSGTNGCCSTPLSYYPFVTHRDSGTIARPSARPYPSNIARAIPVNAAPQSADSYKYSRRHYPDAAQPCT